MKTGQFLNLLENSTGKELIFEYRDNAFVPKAYHITEVKTQHVDSVDCGGNEHSYDETVVQLWVSGNEEKERNMEAEKALKIFNIVNSKKPLKQDTPIYFEWGFGNLATSIYEVKNIKEESDKITVQMFVPPTVCKPNEVSKNMQELAVVGGGGCCGPSDGGSSKCC